MYKVSKNHVIYSMSPNNEPVLSVPNGSRIEFETCDCFTDQIVSETEAFQALDWDRINPATGPVYIEGAEAGDVLAVTIEKIETAPTGIAVTGKGMGTLGSVLEETLVKIFPIDADSVRFNENITLPLNKMIGVIGTAPKSETISCGTPDSHGGNMDCKEIKEGATLYLPVNVPGALLAMGDLHAAMGDGEIGVSGLEVAGKAIVTVNVIKENMPLPMIANPEKIMALASHEDLDAAVDMAVKNMMDHLTNTTDLSQNEAAMLMSLAADVKICQVVDPKKTIRVELDRSYL